MMNLEEAKEELKEYVEQDEIYKDYKKDKSLIKSDFDRFCVNHCEAIEVILQELDNSINLKNKIKKLIKSVNVDIEENEKDERKNVMFNGNIIHSMQIAYSPETVKRTLEQLLEEGE